MTAVMRCFNLPVGFVSVTSISISNYPWTSRKQRTLAAFYHVTQTDIIIKFY